MSLNLAFGLGNNQTCEFNTINIAANGIDGPEDSVYACRLTAFLDDESNQNVEVDTSANSETNDDVKAVEILGYHTATVVKFIPFSIFKVFPFMEYLIMNGGSKELEKLKPGFFTGAENLKVLRIEQTSVDELVANLFKEAHNLKFINLSNNKLKTIDIEAFNGLTGLKSLSLDSNLIENMDPETFSNLKNLNYLSLLENKCIDRSFEIRNGNFKEVEQAIWESCKFDARNRAKPISKPVVPPKVSKQDEKLRLFQGELKKLETNLIESDTKIVGLKEAFDLQKTQLDVVASLALQMDPKKTEELESLIQKHIKSSSIEFSKIPDEINTLTEMTLETITGMENTLKESETKTLKIIEENFNATQRQIVELRGIAEQIGECCKENKKIIKNLPGESTPAEKPVDPMLAFNTQALLTKLDRQVQKLIVDNANLLKRIDSFEAGLKRDVDNL